MPENQHYVEITFPAGISYEEVTGDTVPGWYNSNRVTSKAFGSKWFRENRSLILIVPSIVARLDSNILINTTHDDSTKIEISNEKPITWDERLFI